MNPPPNSVTSVKVWPRPPLFLTCTGLPGLDGDVGRFVPPGRVANEKRIRRIRQRRSKQRAKLGHRDVPFVLLESAAASGVPSRVSGQTVVHNRNVVIVTIYVRRGVRGRASLRWRKQRPQLSELAASLPPAQDIIKCQLPSPDHLTREIQPPHVPQSGTFWLPVPRVCVEVVNVVQSGALVHTHAGERGICVSPRGAEGSESACVADRPYAANRTILAGAFRAAKCHKKENHFTVLVHQHLGILGTPENERDN